MPLELSSILYRWSGSNDALHQLFPLTCPVQHGLTGSVRELQSQLKPSLSRDVCAVDDYGDVRKFVFGLFVSGPHCNCSRSRMLALTESLTATTDQMRDERIAQGDLWPSTMELHGDNFTKQKYVLTDRDVNASFDCEPALTVAATVSAVGCHQRCCFFVSVRLAFQHRRWVPFVMEWCQKNRLYEEKKLIYWTDSRFY